MACGRVHACTGAPARERENTEEGEFQIVNVQNCTTASLSEAGEFFFFFFFSLAGVRAQLILCVFGSA